MKEMYISEIAKELSEENLAIFCGAGFSMSSGFVSWKELMRPIAKEIQLDIEKETDMVAIAQYHVNVNSSNRHKLNQLLIDEFSRNAKLTENHAIIARLPVNEYWTTNYDKLIETALEKQGRIPDVKSTVEQLAYTKPKRDAVVYKMHGDIGSPDKAVLTKDDYESYHVKYRQFIIALAGSLVSRTFLFIGFSFKDPNLDYILGRIRVAYNSNQRRHFCFIKEINSSDYSNNEEYEYDKIKFELFVSDLSRFNIKAIRISDYPEITNTLNKIENLYKRKTIFISGAANDYGARKPNDAFLFIHNLSKTLIQEGYKIVSGFGLGVGSSVITGALEEIYLNPSQSSNDQLLLRPFPQDITGSIDKNTLWRRYREDLCLYSGIAIFLFGNKLESGHIVRSNGMASEFEIAFEKGLFLIPIGSTGFVAEEIWNEINSNLSKYAYTTTSLVSNFKMLNDKAKSDSELISIIISILKEVVNN
ncbi:SIR2 family protein [Leptospira sarikeiensis]|uniref:NAD(+) hydrolase ThsA n=1 Tax=Leptospira sarikeiensis TaxID=2484943 RepID=A0A4R9K6X4_9LEPT|nr:SIR2 family protein [Leptospira sarikeiensis]TGL62028.1 hypothetical protein EHQ64_09185 [Leptospira sarikeiensis]